MTQELYNKAIHPGNSLRVKDPKTYKKAINDLIFNKEVLNIIKNLDVKKEAMILEEIAEKSKVDFEILQEILEHLYKHDLITFCSLFPFTENEFNLDESMNLLQRLQGLGLIDNKYVEQSREILEKVEPLLNELKYTLNEISDIVEKPPIMIKELLKRFKIEYLIVDLE
ncbi:MAG: hypothetical protein ACTSVY_14250 [Candidatus Helarchaeota archaeon]